MLTARHAITPWPALRNMQGTEQPIVKTEERAEVAIIGSVLTISMVNMVQARGDENPFGSADKFCASRHMRYDGIIPPPIAMSDGVPSHDYQVESSSLSIEAEIDGYCCDPSITMDERPKQVGTPHQGYVDIGCRVMRPVHTMKQGMPFTIVCEAVYPILQEFRD